MYTYSCDHAFTTPGINHKSRVLYPDAGILFSAAWPPMLKMHLD